jgi:serine/threonine protein kinase
LLVDSNGTLKLADFGLARAFNLPMKDYTHEVVTLWYRAPEILLGDNNYSLPIDVWACGAIFYEFAHRKPFFYGHSEIDVIFKIFEIWGTPTDKEWDGVESLKFYKSNFPKFKGKAIDTKMCPYFDSVAIDLFKKMIALAPQERISAKEALAHEFFKQD